MYTLNMEGIVLTAAAGLFFMAGVLLLGGGLSHALDCHASRSKPRLSWTSHHTPRKALSGSFAPRHEECVTCEIAVVTAEKDLVLPSSRR